MSLNESDLRDIEVAIGDRIFIQIESWHLYLGDAGLSNALAIECSVNFKEGANIAARKGLESIQVKLAGGNTHLPLARLIPPSQLYELEEILTPYCG